MRRFDYGKYRGIIVSIALFLLLDASVLVLNFYISFEIADDAVAVNLAGRQRMLSQRMTKALLDADYTLEFPEQRNDAIGELRGTSELFNATLKAFHYGGETRGANRETVRLAAVEDPAAKTAIEAAEELWATFSLQLQRLLTAAERGEGPEMQAALGDAIAYARANNLALLKRMNDLTVRLEQLATAKATRLRTIQTVGISLAVANFIFIMLHFVRQLREGDRRVEAARRETTEILETVNEGLFLVDRDLVISGQHSREIFRIFGDKAIAGRGLNDLLGELISARDMETTRNFISLLFSDKVKQRLIGDLNPLDKVQVNLPNDQGGYTTKYLSFRFARAFEDGRIANVLVTVNDITEQVRLAEELEASRIQGEQQLEILTGILHTDPVLLKMFIDGAYGCYNRVNAALRVPARRNEDLRGKLKTIFIEIHNLKGEASALNLESFVSLVHQMEDELSQLGGKPVLSGNDFLPLTVRLNKLVSYTETVQKLITRMGELTAPARIAVAAPSWVHLHDLAGRAAQRCGKSVQLVTSGLGEVVLEDSQRELINQLCIQFIRNAITHGIETPADRRDLNKSEQGRIDIRLATLDDGRLELTVRDDGSGFDYDAIRRSALASGRYSEVQLESMDRRQLLSLIFQSGFSTADTASEDGGRGIGMDVVMSRVNGCGGRLRISSGQGQYCQFVVTLPVAAAVRDAA